MSSAAIKCHSMEETLTRVIPSHHRVPTLYFSNRTSRLSSRAAQFSQFRYIVNALALWERLNLIFHAPHRLARTRHSWDNVCVGVFVCVAGCNCMCPSSCVNVYLNDSPGSLFDGWRVTIYLRFRRILKRGCGRHPSRRSPRLYKRAAAAGLAR